jgi:hypothetical protein
MLSAVSITLVLLAASQASAQIDIFDPSVYSFFFYVNTHPDLIHPPYFTFDGAKQHWQQYGIKEGRQGCGSFHTEQYLERYPDLKQKFGDNYTAALEHYLTTGRAEGRLGFLEGGYGGRWTIASPSRLFVSASDRVSGAIDSVVWNNKEFINCWDHGRELQMAVTTGHGECYNPTEVLFFEHFF